MTAVLRIFERLWLPILLVVIWWFASANSTNPYVPSLQKITEVIARDFSNGVLVSGLVFSLTNLVVGFLIAVVAGVGLGLLLGETRVLFDALAPLINFIRSIPQTAMVPLIIGAFGIGGGPKIGAIAFACVWPILLNTIDGVRGIEPIVRDASRVYRIPTMLHFRRILLPTALPQIVAGVRVALPIAIVMMVVTELFAAEDGIGFYILNSSSRFKIPETWGGALIVGVIGYILSALFILFERRVLRWYFKSAAK